MIQTQENGAKPHFCPGSRPLGRNLSRHFFCSKLPSYAVSRKIYDPNSLKLPKILGQIQSCQAQIQVADFFSQKSDFVSHQILWSAIIVYNIKKKLDFFEKWSTFDQKKFYAIPFLKLVFLVSIYPQFLERKKTKEIKKC